MNKDMILVRFSNSRYLFYRFPLTLINVISFRLGFTEKGSLWVAQTSDRLHTLKRQYATINALGINCEILNVDRIKEKVPIIDSHETWVKKKNVFSIKIIFFCLYRVVFGCMMILWLILSHSL
jgi:hypothetical protein